MKIIKCFRNITVLSAILFSSTAFAYNAGNTEKSCKAPKFTSISPQERKKGDPVPEVGAETEIEFTVSGRADPTTIFVTAKKIPLKLAIVNRNSFYKVTANLPATLNGKFARIDLKAKTQGGECSSKDGWLIKIKEASGETEAVKE